MRKPPINGIAINIEDMNVNKLPILGHPKKKCHGEVQIKMQIQKWHICTNKNIFF